MWWKNNLPDGSRNWPQVKVYFCILLFILTHAPIIEDTYFVTYLNYVFVINIYLYLLMNSTITSSGLVIMLQIINQPISYRNCVTQYIRERYKMSAISEGLTADWCGGRWRLLPLVMHLLQPPISIINGRSLTLYITFELPA